MHFRVFGIPVHVRAEFWLVSVLFGLPRLAEGRALSAVSWVAIVFFSILVHELGHAFLMRAFGRAPRIELWAWGGLTYWGEGPEVSRWRRAAVSLAGPGAGFLVAIPIAAFAALHPVPHGSIAETAIFDALWVNVGWGVLNLLPILPLDGGHVMEVVVTGVAGERGPRWARIVSIVACAGLGGLALWASETWLALFALLFAMRSFRELQLGVRGGAEIPASRARPPIPSEIERLVTESWQAIRTGAPERAIEACDAKLRELPVCDETAEARACLIEMLAWAHLEAGDEDKAVELESAMPEGFRPSGLLAARLQLARGELAEGLRALERAYLGTPGDVPAIVLAAAYVEHGRPDRAIAILRNLRGLRVSSEGHLTISAALFYEGHYAHAYEICELAWNRFGAGVHAYNAACCLARLGKLDEGIAWLSKAVEAGLHESERLEDDDDLAPLRGHSEYARIVERARARREPPPSA